jgi:hypothetical protein
VRCKAPNLIAGQLREHLLDCKVTSDAGQLAYCELDEALRLAKKGAAVTIECDPYLERFQADLHGECRFR